MVDNKLKNIVQVKTLQHRDSFSSFLANSLYTIAVVI